MGCLLFTFCIPGIVIAFEIDSFDLLSSSGPSSANDVEQDYHDGDDQQDMNETAHGMGGDQTQDPKDDQNNGDGPQHANSP
jgi:hypothetical protein